MAQATTTTVGEIVLSGDLAGGTDANFPQLRASGVTPGTYTPLGRLTVDAKGRVVSVASIDWTNLSLLEAIVIDEATTSVKGVLQLGEGFDATAGSIFATLATNTTKGIFSVPTGGGLSIIDGEVGLVYEDLIASSSAFGFVKTGSNVINSAGVISFSTATTSTKGVFQLGPGLQGTGVVSIDASSIAASSTDLGFITAGTGFAMTGDVLSVPVATGSVFGKVQPGAGFGISDGTISIATATDSVKGVFSIVPGGLLNIASGAVSMTSVAKKNVANTFTKAQNGVKSTVAGGATYTPDFQTGPAVIDITLDQNMIFNSPTLAPSGCAVIQTYIMRYNGFTLSFSGGAYRFNNTTSGTTEMLTLIATDASCYVIFSDATGL